GVSTEHSRVGVADSISLHIRRGCVAERAVTVNGSPALCMTPSSPLRKSSTLCMRAARIWNAPRSVPSGQAWKQLRFAALTGLAAGAVFPAPADADGPENECLLPGRRAAGGHLEHMLSPCCVFLIRN